MPKLFGGPLSSGLGSGPLLKHGIWAATQKRTDTFKIFFPPRIHKTAVLSVFSPSPARRHNTAGATGATCVWVTIW
eukprot:SAG31_NODE_1252_length_9108_cov_24.066711_2_plen_76_part_00